MTSGLAATRLVNHGITGAKQLQPADVVRWLGAVQAQEYEPAKWALGLRMADRTVDAQVEDAFERGKILRTHVLRPTWHFVARDDIRWMLDLTAARIKLRMAPYHRQLGLDARTMNRGTAIIERALGDQRYLTRAELGEWLQRSKFTVTTHRLAHLMMHAELEGVACSGPRRGKRFTYALLAQRAPRAPRLKRDEALAELSRRYFRSHGPATIRDFVWWSGLTTPDAKRALEMNRARPEQIDDTTYWTVDENPPRRRHGELAHLLPIYDEYLVAYRDREAVPHGPYTIALTPTSSVSFQHALVIDGQVAGTWKLAASSRGLAITATLLRRLTRTERDAVADAAARYGRFRALPAKLSIVQLRRDVHDRKGSRDCNPSLG
jgi:hypothetical protein